MSETARDVLGRLLHLGGQLHHYQMLQFKHLGPLANPYRGQGRILSILKLKNEIPQKDLGFLLNMRNQSLMELLAKLEKSGFITRRPSGEDRRTMIVTLTEEGKVAAEKPESGGTELAGIFDCLTEEETGKFTEYLDRLIAALEKELGRDENGGGMEDLAEIYERMHEAGFGFGLHGHGFHGRGKGFGGPREFWRHWTD
jgi:DNA-binding MarR family transcriptional regulator